MLLYSRHASRTGLNWLLLLLHIWCESLTRETRHIQTLSYLDAVAFVDIWFVDTWCCSFYQLGGIVAVTVFTIITTLAELRH